MTGLAGHLPEEFVADAQRARQAAPRGHEPGVKWASDGQTATVTLPLMPALATEQDWRQAVDNLYPGVVPEGFRLRLVEARYDPVAWTRQEQGEDALTRPAWRYRFVVERVAATADQVDFAARLRVLRKAAGKRATRSARPRPNDERALVVSWNDWQVGKGENGGTQATLDRFYWCIERMAIGQFYDVGADHLVILGGGDIVEGCDIFPNQAHQLDQDTRGQVNTATDMVLYGLDRLAPMFKRVTVLAVGGNHGENRRQGAKINRHDNADLLVFENAARVAERDKRLGHVDFVIAKSEPVKSIEVAGHILATTHGQAYGKAQSGNIEQKVWKWYTGRSAARLPGGGADVLVTHHYHHNMSRDYGSWLWRQTPALDGASMHFTDGSSMWCRPGMLTAVMHPGSRWTDELVLEPPYENKELGIKLP